MICPRCQFENREGAKFCKECGTNLEVACSECGTVYDLSSKFCDECGQDLRPSPTAQTVEYSRPDSYTPKFLADKILTTRSSIEGERKLVTVLFADVANYTSISEKLDPEDIHQIMDGCFKILMGVIHKYEGTINQFTGDGVMALFGAPIAHEDHFQRACQAALAIQAAMVEYSEKNESEWSIEFKIRIGINSGPVMVGAIGDDLRMDYTAVGDTTNLAARMETMAQPGTILISQNTQRLVKAYFELKSLGPIQVKGKEKPQQVYELIKLSEVTTRFEASVFKGLTRFVGRENSMAAIKSAWNKAISGSGRVLGIVGEAGVGKSRLLLEFKKYFPQDGFIYLPGQCIHYGSSIAYLPFLDILRKYFRVEEGERAAIVIEKINSKLSEFSRGLTPSTLIAIQDLLSLEAKDKVWRNLEPIEKKDRIFEALKDLLVMISQKKPVIVVIEDLHWIDKTSEEFLSHFIDSMAQLPIMLILLYRPEYNHQLAKKTYYSKIGLDQLTLASSSELISAILDGGDAEKGLKELILNRSAGNPLFMEEFTYTLLESGSIKQKNSQFVLNRKIDEIQVPETIHGIIAARIDRLEENHKRIIQLASVVGRDFAFRILQNVTGIYEELQSYLINLQGLEFIYEKQFSPELEYIFKHALTQEVAYNNLLNKIKKETHEKVAMVIEKIYIDKLDEFYEVLAYHYSKTDNYNKIYKYFMNSGKKAAGKNSQWEAYYAYTEALTALEKMPDSDEIKKAKIEICRLLNLPASTLGYPEGSLQIFEKGEKFAAEIEDAQSLAHIYQIIRWYHQTKGDPVLALNYGEHLYHQADKIKDLALLAPTTWDLCLAYQMTGHFTKIIDIAPNVIALLETKKKEKDFFERTLAIYPCLCASYGLCLGIRGEFKKGISFCEKGNLIATEIKDLMTLVTTEFNFGILFANQGEYIRSKKHLESCAKYAKEMNFPFFEGTTSTFIGWDLYLREDLEMAMDKIKQAINTQVNMGATSFLSYSYSFLSIVRSDLGQNNRAVKDAHEALDLALKHKNKQQEGLAKIFLGKSLGRANLNRVDEAAENLLQGINLLEREKYRPRVAMGYFYLGELQVAIGQKENGIENLSKAESMFKKMDMAYWISKTEKVINH